jgi:hypothetical protein
LVFDREITTEDPERGENDPPVIYLPSIVKSSGRIYKGEGAIGLTAYYPYARAPYKTIGEYVDGEQSGGFGNKDEWQSAARIPESYTIGDSSITGYDANLFNPGDIKTPLNCKIKSSEKGIVGLSIKNNKDEGNTSALYYIYLDLSNEDTLEFIIDSKLQLVKDLKGNPRNDLIVASTFLYIDSCENGQTYYLDIYKNNSTNEVVISNIDYDYLYL